jgi:hypothetical protein
LGIFTRKGSAEFWLKPPFSTGDPSVLYQHGLTCVGRSDGPGMMSTGWAIWRLTAIHMYQANQFLTDGFREWQEGGSYDRAVGIRFLQQLFDRLNAAAPPDCPADPWSAPRDLVEPASAYFSTLCWAGSEFLAEAGKAGREDLVAEHEPRIYRAICGVRSYFVPPRSMEEARAYAAKNGWPAPWSSS